MFEKKNVGGEHFSSTEGEKLPLIYQSINSTAVTLTKKPSRDDSFASVQISVKQALQAPWTPAVVVFITMRGDVVVTQFPGVVLDASVAVHIEKRKGFSVNSGQKTPKGSTLHLRMRTMYWTQYGSSATIIRSLRMPMRQHAMNGTILTRSSSIS